MNDIELDQLLNVRTIGNNDEHADEYHYPYEPTDYCVLDRIKESGYLNKDNILLDYGTGKGRVCFYLSYSVGCKSKGIEYDESIFNELKKNQHDFIKNDLTSFECINAEEYIVKDEDVFYFFNPFSIEILKKVLSRIIDSYYENPRNMIMMFYYPEPDTVGYLMTHEKLMFVDEIECYDLYPEYDPRETILCFEINI